MKFRISNKKKTKSKNDAFNFTCIDEKKRIKKKKNEINVKTDSRLQCVTHIIVKVWFNVNIIFKSSVG